MRKRRCIPTALIHIVTMPIMIGAVVDALSSCCWLTLKRPAVMDTQITNGANAQSITMVCTEGMTWTYKAYLVIRSRCQAIADAKRKIADLTMLRLSGS